MSRIAGYYPSTDIWIPLRVDNTGAIAISGDITVGEITVGAVDQGDAGAEPWLVTIADGDDVTLGTIADASVLGDNPGTVNAHLRGLGEILADVWDSVNNRVRVNVENATIAVTLPGDVEADIDQIRDQIDLITPDIDAIRVAVEILDNAIAGSEMQVDVVTSALPTGAATSAKQDTIIGHVDGLEGLLTTIDADTGNISTKIDTLAGAVAGTEFQVDVLTSALPTGAATSAKQDTAQTALDAIKTAIELLDNAVSGNEFQVDVLTLPALAAGTNAVGKLLPPDIDITGHTNYAKKYYTSTGAATDGIIWSPAAGKRWHITSFYVQVSAACTVTIEDDKAGGDEVIFKSEFAANSGAHLRFDAMYPWASGEDAADLLITTTAGNVYVTAVGYEI